MLHKDAHAVCTTRWQGTDMCCMVAPAYKSGLPLQTASAGLTNHSAEKWLLVQGSV